jgi:hypothetical protein
MMPPLRKPNPLSCWGLGVNSATVRVVLVAALEVEAVRVGMTASKAGELWVQRFLDAQVRAHDPTCPPAVTGLRDAVSNFRSSPTAAIALSLSPAQGITLNAEQPASM